MTENDVEPRPFELRVARRRRMERVAQDQGGVLSRAQAYAAGMTRAEVRAEIRAGRWQRVWSRSLATHTGEISPLGRRWAAVFEGGSRAVLDGDSALVAAGLERWQAERIRVSVPRGVKRVRAQGLDVRQTRRWREEDRAAGGLPRTKPAVAAIRAALWARSDRQATLILTMAVQQGLVRAEDVAAELLAVRRDRRRQLLHFVVLDLLGGTRALGEIDVARECRRRGLPDPTRQVLRVGKHGRYYLDVVWEEWGLVLEIDGIQHTWVENIVHDALRHNEIALSRQVVLKIPLLGLRLQPDDFYRQVEEGLRGAGWNPAA